MKKSVELLKEEYWKTIIQECNHATKSGEMTKKAWLKENHICQATFYKWQQLLRNQIASDLLNQNSELKLKNELVISDTMKEVEFIEVKPSVPFHPCASGAVVKFNQASIEINEDISEELLAKIFKVISNVE